MSQVTVTLPDGSARIVPAGARVRDVAEAISPRLAKAALAGVVDGKLVDLTFPLDAERVGPDRHRQQSRSAAALPAQHGAPARGGGHQSVPRRPVRHRSGDRRRLLLRLRRAASVRARGSRGHRAEDARARRRRIWSTSARCGRAKKRRRSSPTRGEPLKVQLIDEKTEGQREVSCYTIKDKDTFIDFCVGPHVPSTGRLKAFKLLHDVERLLEGRRAQSADAAHLRHRVLLRQGAEGATSRRSRKRRSATTGSSVASSGLFMFHQWAPGAAFWLRQGHDALPHARPNYMRDVLFPAGYVEVKTPLVFNKALWETSGHWSHYRQNMFLDRVDRRRADGHEGDELPGPHARLRAARCAAIATCRCACTSRRRCIATKRPACCPA